MSNQAFFPNREGDQLQFFANIQSKIAGYFTALDVNALRQAKLLLVLEWLIWTWGTYMPTRRQDAPTATSYRNQLATGTSDASTNVAVPLPGVVTPPAGTPFFGMVTWLFEEIARWKKAEGYTDTIGNDLGIIGSAPVAHPAPPVLTGKNLGNNNVELSFTLYEHDAVKIQSMVQGENAFTDLATDSSSPYNDTRPVKTAGQAEWRDYRACWYDNDTATLAYGPVVRVLVQG